MAPFHQTSRVPQVSSVWRQSFSWVASHRTTTDLSSAECRDTQLSLVGCETEVNSVTAGESRHALTSQRDCNVSRDHPPPHNPSTPVPAEDETEPANQRLFRCSSEAGAEPRKSSLPPVLGAHSIQLQTRDLSPTRDSHLGVHNDGIEAHSTDCRLGDETLSSPVSPVLQQQEQTGSGSEGEDTPRDLSRSCSVSVVVPVTRSHGLPITRSTRTSRNRCTRKRKSRAKSTCDVDSDDPDDIDYTDGNDVGVGDIAASPRPVKRQRRTAATKTQPARVQRESPHHKFSSPAPEEAFANPYPATTLQDMQTIPVRGFLTRQTFLSRVVYSCTFEEDRQPSCPHGPTPTKAPAHDENLDETGHPTLPSSKKPSAHATRFLPDEDELLIELKEKRCLPWSRIVKHFPGRTKGSLQVRYSTRLKDRGTGCLGRGRSGRVTCSAAASAAPQEACGLLSRSQMARRKGADSISPTRQHRFRCAIDRYSSA